MSPSSKYAIIDLGTNTCNLFIAEFREQKILPIYRTSVPVKLGKGGINNMTILPDAVQRAIKGINYLIQICKDYGVGKVIAFATSAVRSADNKVEFIREIARATTIKINVIDGDTEAQLIYKGVADAVDLSKGNKLILDIGGGSNEFIITSDSAEVWRKSFNIGVARIIEMFPPSDPISSKEIKQVENYYDEQLAELWEACSLLRISELVGCAGAFNTFVDLLEAIEPDTTFFPKYSFEIKAFKSLYSTIVHSNRATRIGLKGMTDYRVDMVVQGTILVDLVIRKLKIEHITQSGNALREGAMKALMDSPIKWIETKMPT